MKSTQHNRQQDIRKLAKILRDGGYTYDQSSHLVKEARRLVGLTSPKRKRGSVERLTRDEFEAQYSLFQERRARSPHPDAP